MSCTVLFRAVDLTIVTIVLKTVMSIKVVRALTEINKCLKNFCAFLKQNSDGHLSATSA